MANMSNFTAEAEALLGNAFQTKVMISTSPASFGQDIMVYVLYPGTDHWIKKSLGKEAVLAMAMDLSGRDLFRHVLTAVQELLALPDTLDALRNVGRAISLAYAGMGARFLYNFGAIFTGIYTNPTVLRGALLELD